MSKTENIPPLHNPHKSGEEPAFTVKRWLSAKASILDKDGILSILAEFGISPENELCEIPEKIRDLMLAQCYFEMVMQCSESAEIKDADGNWSHSEGSRNVTEADKSRWKAISNKLRRKWGEEGFFIPSIRMQSHGIKTWRKL